MKDKLKEIVERYGFQHYGSSVFYNESEDDDTHAFNCSNENNAEWAAKKINAAITRAVEEAMEVQLAMDLKAALEAEAELQQLRKEVVECNAYVAQAAETVGKMKAELQQLRGLLKEIYELMPDWTMKDIKVRVRAAIDEAMQ